MAGARGPASAGGGSDEGQPVLTMTTTPDYPTVGGWPRQFLPMPGDHQRRSLPSMNCEQRGQMRPSSACISAGSVPLGVGYRGAGMRPGGRCRCCCCGGCVDRDGWWEGERCGGGGGVCGGAGGGGGGGGGGGWGGGRSGWLRCGG